MSISNVASFGLFGENRAEKYFKRAAKAEPADAEALNK
jgi:hypothetical protein